MLHVLDASSISVCHRAISDLDLEKQRDSAVFSTMCLTTPILPYLKELCMQALLELSATMSM